MAFVVRGQAGFSKAQEEVRPKVGISCAGQATTFAHRTVRVPKMGAIKMRGGKLPKRRLLAARIWRDGNRWMSCGQFFTCAKCGRVQGRDRNAAHNIYWMARNVGTVSANTLRARRSGSRGAPSGLSRCRSLSRQLRHMVVTMKVKVNNCETSVVPKHV